MDKNIVVLAGALPLLLCLLCLLVLVAFLFLRIRHYRVRNRFLVEEVRHVNDECAKLKSNLAAFPKAWDADSCYIEYSDQDLITSMFRFKSKLERYLQKWVDCDTASMNESPARIESILFPQVLQPYPETPAEHLLSEIPAENVLDAGHLYSPQQDLTREAISLYIIGSTLIKAVSIDNAPRNSLLPFQATEVDALHKVKSLIRGVELFCVLPAYISKFGFPYQRASTQLTSGVSNTRKDEYFNFFESLLEPYFTSNSQESIVQRKLEFEEVLEAAIQHGMKVVGLPDRSVEYRWGMRSDRAISINPAMYNFKLQGSEAGFHERDLGGIVFTGGRDLGSKSILED